MKSEGFKHKESIPAKAPSARAVMLSQYQQNRTNDENVSPDSVIDWSDPTIGVYTTDDIPDGTVIIMERWVYNRGWHKDRNGFYRRMRSHWARWADSSVGSPGEWETNGNSNVGSPTPLEQYIPFTPTDRTKKQTVSLPLSRFCVDYGVGSFYTNFTRALPVFESTSYRFTKSSKRSTGMHFQIYLGIPNPNWKINNHQPKYIVGEPVRVSAYLRTQSFNDGSGTLNYYIGWQLQFHDKGR